MKYILILLSFLLPFRGSSQIDSSGVSCRNKILLAGGATITYGLTVLGMNELWYKNYEHSSFHWIDDSHEWLQMDKAGHSFSAYQTAGIISYILKTSGVREKKSVFWGSGMAMLGISTVEYLDGHSAGWGASASDLIANFSGISFFAFQNLYWKEEKIIPKFSWHPTSFSKYRPDVLGHSYLENILKDYNGETFWLSANLKSISRWEKIPPWLCLSFGYGAEGMINGYDDPEMIPYFERYRQFYISPDIDLSKIKIRNPFVKTLLSGLNFIKIPLPTMAFSSKGVQLKALYF